MKLILQFKKGNQRPSVLICLRSNGSITWTKLHPGIEDHDLAHYVVEMELGFRTAFYGMIHQGFEVSDFELPRNHRPEALLPKNLSEEALQTELIVNLLQTEYWNSGKDPNFLKTLAEMHADKEIPFPEKLSQEKLQVIRQKYKELIGQWRALAPDDILELEFLMED